MLSHLKPADGVAGFLLANGALNDSDTLEIRKKLIQNDKVEAIIVLPRELFITTVPCKAEHADIFYFGAAIIICSITVFFSAIPYIQSTLPIL